MEDTVMLVCEEQLQELVTLQEQLPNQGQLQFDVPIWVCQHTPPGMDPREDYDSQRHARFMQLFQATAIERIFPGVIDYKRDLHMKRLAVFDDFE